MYSLEKEEEYSKLKQELFKRQIGNMNFGNRSSGDSKQDAFYHAKCYFVFLNKSKERMKTYLELSVNKSCIYLLNIILNIYIVHNFNMITNIIIIWNAFINSAIPSTSGSASMTLGNQAQQL